MSFSLYNVALEFQQYFATNKDNPLSSPFTADSNAAVNLIKSNKNINVVKMISMVQKIMSIHETMRLLVHSY